MLGRFFVNEPSLEFRVVWQSASFRFLVQNSPPRACMQSPFVRHVRVFRNQNDNALACTYDTTILDAILSSVSRNPFLASSYFPCLPWRRRRVIASNRMHVNNHPWCIVVVSLHIRRNSIMSRNFVQIDPSTREIIFRARVFKFTLRCTQVIYL